MTTVTGAVAAPAGARGPIELNGLNLISEAERRGRPRQLFWPWFAGNVSTLAMSYGSYFLGFGISLWQACVAAAVGVGVSFVLVGLVSIAGRRGSAPTMVLSRAAFGVNGNRLASLISWLLLVGWEVAGVSLGAEATATVLTRAGLGGGDLTKAVAFAVMVALVVGGAVAGFAVIMRMTAVITVGLVVLSPIYMILVRHHVDAHKVASLPSGSAAAFIGAAVLAATAYGFGWVNCAADYSRYLPRRSSARGIVGWTTLGGTVGPVILIIFGMLLAGSSKALNSAIQSNPIGALEAILPTWFLIPFAVVVILGVVGATVLDLYSSGLALLTLGLRVPRYVAACIDGAIMIGL